MMTTRRMVAAALTFAILQGVCGLPAEAQDAQLTKLRVGYIPVGIYSYFWRARDAGYFKEDGLEVELVPMAGGGQIIPALQSGALQFGISDALGVLNARNGGIPATYVSFNFSQSSDDPVHAVLTLDPDIKSAADLKGKSVATNLSYNTDWTMMREWLRKEKVDLQSITFREIPFPSRSNRAVHYAWQRTGRSCSRLLFHRCEVAGGAVRRRGDDTLRRGEPGYRQAFGESDRSRDRRLQKRPAGRAPDDCCKHQDSSCRHRQDGPWQLANRRSAGADAVLGRCG
jgi:hypothetical protein